MKDQLIDYIVTNYNESVDVIENADMKEYTSFRIGGPCDIALFPHDRESFCAVLRYLNKHSLKHIVIGNGSNVLFADEGYRGIVVFTTKMKNFSFNGDILECDAGVQLTAVSVRAVKDGYEGYAFACGIPGSIGGAVYMNAGAYEGQIADVLLYSDYYDPATGEISRLSAEEHRFGYRYSSYMDTDRIVVSAGFRLEKAKDPSSVVALMEDHIRARKEKQPLEYPSAGSVFKRPEGYFAGALIEQSGLKGKRIGGAMVSEKHAGFIINYDNATTDDVISLIKHCQETVKKKFSVELETEIRFV